MITKIQKWGNSQGIRIPKGILEEVKWSRDENIVITIDNGRLIIDKASKKKRNIREILKDHDGEYTTEEVDWGKAEGREVW